MKLKINKIVMYAASCLLLIMVSCTRIYFDEPLKGKIILLTDWTKRTTGITQPTNYTVVINNESLIYTKDTNLLPELEMGTYPVYVYNTPDKVIISGTTVMVNITNNTIDPLPGWLFTSVTKVVYENSEEKTAKVIMQQQQKQLTIKLIPIGASNNKIINISAQLSGIAAKWDFKTNKPIGNPMKIPLMFVLQSDGSWQSTVRLLGIIGSEQKLIGTVSFDKGYPSDMEINDDLSLQLKDINEDKHIPLLLDGIMQETPTNTGFRIKIKEWQSGTSSEVIAK